jgi:death-on-curing family protein
VGQKAVVYLTVGDVIALYDLAMRASGQDPGALVREDALQSAVHHPRNLAWYEDASLAEQAVELMLHIALAHAWVDGNKRIATLSLYMFLGRNGVTVPSEDEYRTVADQLVSWRASSPEERPSIRDDLVRRVSGWTSYV